jgi:outer membrane receptor protein involved in Fe transport
MLSNTITPLSRHLSRALGLLAAGLQAGALAQQGPDLNAMPLEQLLNLDVVTASKIPQKISEAPSSVSVITAEGIETQEQSDFLRANGCDKSQGYLYGRPCPAAQIGQMLAQARNRACTVD